MTRDMEQQIDFNEEVVEEPEYSIEEDVQEDVAAEPFEAGDEPVIVVPTEVVDVDVKQEEPFGEVSVDDDSTLSIDGGVVEKIVAMTCRNIDGVLQMKGNLISSIQGGFRGSDSRKGVSVEMSGDDACTVNVAIIMEYGKSAPRIFQEIHDSVSSAIMSMTGLKVAAVNVRVTNVMTRAEVESHRRSKQED